MLFVRHKKSDGETTGKWREDHGDELIDEGYSRSPDGLPFCPKTSVNFVISVAEKNSSVEFIEASLTSKSIRSVSSRPSTDGVRNDPV